MNWPSVPDCWSPPTRCIDTAGAAALRCGPRSQFLARVSCSGRCWTGCSTGCSGCSGYRAAGHRWAAGPEPHRADRPARRGLPARPGHHPPAPRPHRPQGRGAAGRPDRGVRALPRGRGRRDAGGRVPRRLPAGPHPLTFAPHSLWRPTGRPSGAGAGTGSNGAGNEERAQGADAHRFPTGPNGAEA